MFEKVKSPLPYFFLFVFLISGNINSQDLDNFLSEYWTSPSFQQRKKIAQKIISKNLGIKEAEQKLKAGKRYSSSVKKGFSLLKQADKALPPNGLLFVPYDYDPLKKYPVNILLHGAVSNLSADFLFKQFVDTTAVAFRQTQSIQIYPAGWFLAPWWSHTQAENIKRLLASVKEWYNVDENQVRLGGVSDGATGSFFLANCNITPWSCITPFIGSLETVGVLSPRQVYMNNFSKTPFLIVNTGRDHIFPKKYQIPYLKLLTDVNPKAHVIWVDSAGHSMRWFGILKDSINSFVKHHPRTPYPEEIIWQTENEKLYGRNKFVIIDRVAKTKTNANVTDPNDLANANGIKAKAYKRDSLSGIIKVKREGNTFHVELCNIKKYTLLLSPDFVDYQKPVIVFTNGIKSFEGIITPSLETLFKWNIIDNDRTMLFDAELQIKAP